MASLRCGKLGRLTLAVARGSLNDSGSGEVTVDVTVGGVPVGDALCVLGFDFCVGVFSVGVDFCVGDGVCPPDLSAFLIATSYRSFAGATLISYSLGEQTQAKSTNCTLHLRPTA